uniref:Uncharacterized protein n=1 Tax=Anguilla anguilla TaxID=7936 RepID=A0A0E9UNW0_ANGAN
MSTLAVTYLAGRHGPLAYTLQHTRPVPSQAGSDTSSPQEPAPTHVFNSHSITQATGGIPKL